MEVVEPVMAAVAILLSADHVRRTTEYTSSCALSQHNLFSLIVFLEKYLQYFGRYAKHVIFTPPVLAHHFQVAVLYTIQ